MDPILDKARGGQNLLERIANAIPGFKGYREKELRRDADRLQREHLATRLEESKKVLNRLADRATRGGGLEPINDIETAKKRLDRVANRIRYADRGYAGFFDTVKVDERALQRVYEFDMALLEAVEAIRTLLASAEGADGAAAVKSAIAEIDALDARLSEREAILTGIK
ncbi:MAG TPA: hypothetical protein VGQ78_00595 [Vicinamibacteria bacterium]|nr:hypothetical protein [Vicinamibacteria bacterium]